MSDIESLLSGQNCIDSSRIRAFLRLSRIATDDSIKTHLNEISSGSCDDYFKTHIVPQWNARASVIQYCKNYSDQLKKDITEPIPNDTKEFDLRLDPYALKAYEQSKHAKYTQIDTIENWIENEQMIESIVRDQTQNTLNDKCYYRDWMRYFHQLSDRK